jgi:hypothetical protein
MVWASTKLILFDYIYPTYQWVPIEYEGKNVHLLYKKVKEALHEIFRIPLDNLQERSYDWKKTEKGEQFSAEWEAIRQLDEFSYIKMEVKLKGFIGKDKVGKIKIQYRPALVTEYPQDTFWQQSILYEALRRLWHIIFYRKKRNEYYQLARDLAQQFDTEIKEFIAKL